MFNLVVRSTVYYGSQAWGFEQFDKMFQKWFIKRICRVIRQIRMSIEKGMNWVSIWENDDEKIFSR